MHSQFPVSYQPIRDIQFEGLHLIEASAGTGKTYTLSSLMVRIFLEKYLPHQVIATTFTRAAAAAGADLTDLDMPEVGTLDIRQVLESPFFFC